MADLPALQAAIDAAAAKVVKLKADGAGVADIKAAVAELLAGKTAYADSNNGKLADGTPFDPNASKKDKKKKKKDDGDKAANEVRPREGWVEGWAKGWAEGLSEATAVALRHLVTCSILERSDDNIPIRLFKKNSSLCVLFARALQLVALLRSSHTLPTHN